MTEESCHRPDRKDWRGDLSEEIRRDLLVRPSVVRLHPYRLDRKGAAELEKKVV
jgi:hypothetical protein